MQGEGWGQEGKVMPKCRVLLLCPPAQKQWVLLSVTCRGQQQDQLHGPEPRCHNHEHISPHHVDLLQGGGRQG